MYSYSQVAMQAKPEYTITILVFCSEVTNISLICESVNEE